MTIGRCATRATRPSCQITSGRLVIVIIALVLCQPDGESVSMILQGVVDGCAGMIKFVPEPTRSI